MDEGPAISGTDVSVTGAPPHPLRRGMVAAQLPLGVRVLDGLIPCGKGQRLGIFAGSGVGKSSLMSMIARGTAADVSVVALIGERGREVAEFIARDLGPEGLARSVVVVATSDAPAVMRIRAAFTATRIAEWFRDQGNDVVLMMDSVTRFAMAQREVGLAAGEPPATRGLSAQRLRAPSPPPGAGRPRRARVHYRPLHRSGRGGRHERTDRRHRSIHPRRPYPAFAEPSPSPTTTRRSTCWARSPGWRRRWRSPSSCGPEEWCASCWRHGVTPRT